MKNQSRKIYFWRKIQSDWGRKQYKWRIGFSCILELEDEDGGFIDVWNSKQKKYF